jgi:hypothetical protein
VPRSGQGGWTTSGNRQECCKRAEARRYLMSRNESICYQTMPREARPFFIIRLYVFVLLIVK